MPQINNGPRIKNEPGLEQNGVSAAPPLFNPPQAQPPAGLSAEARAAFNLHASYGNRAANSINALQSAMPQQQQQQQPKLEPGLHSQSQQMQMPNNQQPMQRPQMTEQQFKQQQYNQMMAQQARARQQGLQQNQKSPQNGINNAQTDGAGDETVAYLQFTNSKGENEEMGRVEIDSMIRRRIEAMGRTMEGGGLMLPLSQHKPEGNSKKHKVASSTGDLKGSAIPQTDGADSDDDLKDEADEDAINSDLDDPDDGLNEDDDEEDDKANVMLCMYDKVQRVKNKWKCVMKDGVITINGKEYVFHKASGEYEW